MKTNNFLSSLCVSLAIFALPAAAQTPDGMTPAKEDVCNSLAGETPGLYGLCVGFCEAQDCEATLIDPVTREVEFDPSCKSSTLTLFDNFEKKAGPDGPLMPCLEVPCPCWSEAQLDEVAGRQVNNVSTDTCLSGEGYAQLWGVAADGSGMEAAYAVKDGSGTYCYRVETDTNTEDQKFVSSIEYDICRQSVLDECSSRGK